MKKIAFILFAFVATFSSCSSDNNNEDNEITIIGSWELKADKPANPKDTYISKQKVTFLPNGTLSSEAEILRQGKKIIQNTNGKYTTSGNKLTVITVTSDGKENTTESVYKIDGNKLTITTEGKTQVYTRV
ncbi:lipocalin family protein [Polaribacter cellanae]|uniref:Lipocalin-like domain-containing protein n=1 Tax=Polaribacter cellanae TaxID=2818493 RepID=A0A975CQA3_9FLAO|nr:lipocalin family protein [Polaribacter cellanae]QTE21912.1 hypothetical protein J3359_13980 [Polaribacter cellanae]